MSSGTDIPFIPLARSLVDLLGSDYVQAVCQARTFLSGERAADVSALGEARLEFYPESMRRRLNGMH